MADNGGQYPVTGVQPSQENPHDGKFYAPDVKRLLGIIAMENRPDDRGNDNGQSLVAGPFFKK